MAKPGEINLLELLGMLKGYGMATELPGHLVGPDWREPVQDDEHRQMRSTRNMKGAVAEGLLPPALRLDMFIPFDQSIDGTEGIYASFSCWQAQAELVYCSCRAMLL